ncbi:hypothetical protein BO221_28230 [Archangium sp. Cb G35]|uniref:hypothetical protein n=1 Tax=Archangium sp. Cb G35 TaxID=1920190 RepID=UPI000936CF16|nr:hypothetical protein [Archangium sp. Cb G35]OJT20802.1 hypothetical protein BO221_28230 [Archangium sp. Cb G35]
MNRRFLPCVLFTLCLASAALAQRPPPPPSPTPPWLPRGAYLGTFIRDGVIAPQARLQWQLVFFQGRSDTLGLLIEPMAAIAVARPATVVEDEDVPMTSLQYYSLMFALGYTSRRGPGWEWGFQVGTGPAWLHARFENRSTDEEFYLGGLLDGRARIGYRFSSVSLGFTVGYGDPYNYRRSSLARSYVGGLQLGFYADWR